MNKYFTLDFRLYVYTTALFDCSGCLRSLEMRFRVPKRIPKGDKM
jgi:hypothetical protein